MARKLEGSPIPTQVTGVPTQEEDATAEARLAIFFERNKDFFTLYAGDTSIKAKPSRKLGTFAIDLENGDLYGDPSYYEKKGMTEAHAFNSFLHEFEHFRRLITLLRERGGLEKWRKHRDRVKAKPHLHVFDNVLEDISVDRAILSRAPNQQETQFDLYRSHLWPKTDFTELPKHLQFIYALFREQMMPKEPVKVSDEVRSEIERLRKMKNASGQNVIEVMSNPDLPQAKRLALQESFFEPVYERFFEQDVKEKKEQEEKKKAEGGGGEDGEKDQSPGQSQPGKPEKPGEGKPDKGEGKPEPGQGTPQPGESKPGESGTPDDLFKELYNEYFEKSPDAALADQQIEDAVNKVTKAKGKPKSAEDLVAEAYAKEAGVSVEDLQAYQRFWETVEELRAPEADTTVVEEIRAVFRKILTERLEPVSRPKQPVEEGEYLVRPAEAVADVRAGRTEPRVWMTYETRERPKELFGAFDVTVVCDRSLSMNKYDGVSVKNAEQQKAVMLVLEALREFCDNLDEKRADLMNDLHVRSEVWGFGGPPEVGCIKALSEELTDKQRVAVFKELNNTPGKSTRDDLALNGLADSVSEEDWERVRKGELRKVVIVLTDGDSSNKAGAKKAIKDLREKGVIVVAIGITNAAENALKLYAPDAHLAKTAAETGVAVGKVLETFIGSLNG